MTGIGIGFGLTILIFFFFYRMISQYKIAILSNLHSQQQEIQARYDFVVNRKKELTKQLAEKKQQLATLRNSQQGIRTVSSSDLDFSDMNETDKISNYLLSRGKITMEQNERALKKMETLKLDFLGVCMALGFIDLKTSKQALKANTPG